MKKLLGAALLCTAMGATAETNLSILVLYNSNFAASTDSPRAAIASAVAYTNQAFINSQMDVRLTVAGTAQLNLPDSSEVSDGLLGRVVSADPVNDLRNTYRPDLVTYITKSSSSICGLAKFPVRGGSPRFSPTLTSVISDRNAVSVVGFDCLPATFAHELGHNLGAGHGPVEIESSWAGGLITDTDRLHEGFPLDWSKGHGERDVFRTIMAYSDVFGSAPRIAYFSNPNVKEGHNLPTGTSGRNAARGISEAARQLVQYNSNCYPLVEEVFGGRLGNTTRTVCGAKDRYCLNWETETVMQGRVRKTVNVCTELDPN